MRVLLFLCTVAASFLLAPPAAIGHPGNTVAEGAFRFWKPSDGVVTWTSAGIRIRIEPAPCRTPPQTEGCSFDHVNNQPLVTITAPDLPDYRTLGVSQSSFYRIAVSRLQPGDSRPGIVLENQSGGSGGDVREQILLPEGSGYREQILPGHLQGELPARLSDLSGDGAVDFVLGDGSFDGAFGCNACTPRPPMVLSFRNGVARACLCRCVPARFGRVARPLLRPASALSQRQLLRLCRDGGAAGAGFHRVECHAPPL